VKFDVDELTAIAGCSILFRPTFYGSEVRLAAGPVNFDNIFGATVCKTVRCMLWTIVLSVLAQPPQFSAHVYCGQTAGWMKMPLGTKAGLGPGHIVLDGDPYPSKRAQPSNFRPCLLWPNFRPSQLLLSTCWEY